MTIKLDQLALVEISHSSSFLRNMVLKTSHQMLNIGIHA